MSQENVEAVLGIFEQTNARDFPAVMDAYADDIVLVLPGEMRGLGGGTVVGKEAVGEWFGDWFRTFDPDYTFEIEESRDLGDRGFSRRRTPRTRARQRSAHQPIDGLHLRSA